MQPPNPIFGQIVIMTKSLEARDRVMPAATRSRETEFVGTDVFVHSLDIGPPVGRPIQYRVSGPDLQTVRDLRARARRHRRRQRRCSTAPTYDWNEPAAW